ncbi:MAG: carboxypeptidase-like regulatory domain-containing protein [Bacteroidetes bacterium]|nr:carboxypeptidase-like regulatory domain-containing protein [Bacteroidota bacterium]MBI3483421.1 carboxypeptidase-like regulatory domain-containing protein [Bacteroidota bacterium]
MTKWLIIFLTFSQLAFAQQIISGKIVDAETGKPISFASVSIVGTSKGTSSNLNGEFTLPVSESVSLKITCVGYESVEINGAAGNQLIQMKPIAILLNAVVVFNKAVNPKKIVRRAFASIDQNYIDHSFMQKFFYRHYCKDDSAYGRLIEAFVDVWKNEGYHSRQKSAVDKEEIRVTQLRRSLDRTTLAQGHEPISVKNILQTDIVAYQTAIKSDHMSFYTEVSNLKTDLDSYSFTFEGITTYDGQEVYEISYAYKKDSALTTSGQYLTLTQATGSLFITTDTYAFVKTEEAKQFERNTIRSSTYYRKYNNRYYPYQLIREGENYLSDNGIHSFHIDLMSVEIRTDAKEKFVGHEPGREELLNIPYDSVFWSNNAVLKTTPLEDEIIRDLGEGISLNKQFYMYRQYEANLRDGGKNGVEKFNWFKKESKGKRILYLFFWSSDCKLYLTDLELAKQLNKKYRNRIAFVFLSLDEDEMQWQQTVSKYALYADGIINYRIGEYSEIQKFFRVADPPAFILISRSGEVFDSNGKRPSNPALEDDFKLLLGKSN